MPSSSAREACRHAPALDAKHDAVRDDLVAATTKQWSRRQQARRIHQPVDPLVGVRESNTGADSLDESICRVRRDLQILSVHEDFLFARPRPAEKSSK